MDGGGEAEELEVYELLEAQILDLNISSVAAPILDNEFLTIGPKK